MTVNNNENIFYVLLVKYPGGRLALPDRTYKTHSGAVRGGKARLRRGAESVEIYRNNGMLKLPI